MENQNDKKYKKKLIISLVISSIMVLLIVLVAILYIEPPNTKVPKINSSLSNKSNEKREYGIKMSSLTDDITNNLMKLSDLCDKPTLTDSWKTSVIVVCNNLKENVNQARLVKAPNEYYASHAIFLQGMDNLEKACDNLIYGVTNNNSDSIDVAGNYLVISNTYIKESTSMFKKITN